MLEISDFESSRIALFVKNTKVLISCAITVQLIYHFVFAYARFLLHLIYNKTQIICMPIQNGPSSCTFLCKYFMLYNVQTLIISLILATESIKSGLCHVINHIKGFYKIKNKIFTFKVSKNIIHQR